MTEIDNDKLLRDFFAENKQEIADNGFSRRVMHHLPDRSNRLARIWSAFVHKQNRYRLKVRSISSPDFYILELNNSLSLFLC